MSGTSEKLLDSYPDKNVWATINPNMYLLKYRSRGKSVQLLQELLNAFDNNLEADGYFGRITEAAVKAFQQENGLNADGIVFTQTWAKLIIAPPSIINQTPLSSEELARLQKTLLKKGTSEKEAVIILQELLNHLGADLVVDGDFGRGTDKAVKNFQQNNGLVADGIVFTKTWTKLLALTPPIAINRMRLSEKDYVDFAKAFDLEVPIVKAVQEVESRGSGFLKDNRPIILFEGHIFWRELKKRGFDPEKLQTGNENILFPRFNRAFYEGGAKEYIRLEKARNVGKSPEILEAALASCSWGMFQIMGFNYHLVNNFNVIDYVAQSKRSEAEHLEAFGEFIKSTKLLKPLREKRWADFARGYNGKNFAVNQYDKRLKNAYLKHSATDLLG